MRGIESMKESKFRFQDPYLNKLEFYINENYEASESEVSICNKFSVTIKKDDNKPIASVSLDAIIGDKETAPFYIDCEMASNFIWDGSSYDEQTINDLLSINAPSLLLGYIRPIVSQITNMSECPPYNIPFYNFLDED